MTIELKLHRELYPGNLVDEAAKVFAPHATIERAEEPAHWVLRVTGRSAAREKRIAGELANWALGLTVQKRSAR